MKSLNYVVLLSALVTISASSQASPLYFGVEAGVSHANKLDKVEYADKRAKDSLVYGAKVGYKFNQYFRSDVSLMSISKHKFSGVPAAGTAVDQKLSSTVGMINGYYDFHFAKVSLFTPYVAAGLGFARNKAGDIVTTGIGANVLAGKSKAQFAWSLGAGVNAAVNKNMDIDLSYRYLDLGKFSSSNTIVSGSLPNPTAVSTKFKSNLFTIGLRVNF